MPHLFDSHPSHTPFQSNYRPNFEVVEERRGKITLFPHTDQLSLLLRALHFEFYGALPPRVARTDHRGDGFHKLVLRNAALMYCSHVNRSRPDRVRLFDLPDANLVFKISIVQQISEDTPLGKTHRFRFYAGADFFPEIRLSGRRLVFADHVLQRFSKRVPNSIGEDLSNFLEIFYGHAVISLPCGKGRAFVVPHLQSIVAFPYREETPGEYFIATCLTVKQIKRLEMELPPCVHNFHYADNYTSPVLRHWRPGKKAFELLERWSKKQQMIHPPATDKKNNFRWDTKLGLSLRDATTLQGEGPGSHIYFQDGIPGPHIAVRGPSQGETLYDEMDFCRQTLPQCDWATAFARRDAILRGEQEPALPPNVNSIKVPLEIKSNADE